MSDLSQTLNRRIVPLALGVLLFVLLVWFAEVLIRSQQHSSEMTDHLNVQSDLYSIQDKVERSLNSILHLSIGITAFIEAKQGEIDEKEVLALMESLYGHSHGDHVRHFSLVEDTTIVAIYPQQGNEMAMGINLREVPEYWPPLLAAMNSSDGVLAGPMDLLTGGGGLVFGSPVRVEGSQWGVFNTVIDMQSYMAEIASYRKLSGSAIAVRAGEELLFGEAQTFSDPNAQFADVPVPGGKWELAMVPRGGDQNRLVFAWRILGWILAAVMGAGLTIILIQRGALQNLALIDELTGIANRRQFDLMLDRFCRKYNRRDSGCFAVLYVDLDRFKLINDQHGHRAGDYFLVEVSKKISRAIRGGDLLARWGGDEFAIIVDNPTETSIARVVDRVRELAEQPIAWRNEILSVGASIGVVQYPDDGHTPEDLVAVADQKMYSNKNARREAREQ